MKSNSGKISAESSIFTSKISQEPESTSSFAATSAMVGYLFSRAGVTVTKSQTEKTITLSKNGNSTILAVSADESFWTSCSIGQALLLGLRQASPSLVDSKSMMVGVITGDHSLMESLHRLPGFLTV